MTEVFPFFAQQTVMKMEISVLINANGKSGMMNLGRGK